MGCALSVMVSGNAPLFKLIVDVESVVGMTQIDPAAHEPLAKAVEFRTVSEGLANVMVRLE
jgi:hypothetical protein